MITCVLIINSQYGFCEIVGSNNNMLRSQFLEYAIKTICFDNVGVFISQSFNNYCISIGIKIEHPVAHVHTQNGLVESLIKHLQLIARSMLMRTKLIGSAWGHVILHTAPLTCIRPTRYHKFSLLQLIFDQKPNISHLEFWVCIICFNCSITTHKDGTQRRLGIYVRYEFSSIIKFWSLR